MILTCSALIVALAAGLADAILYGSGTVGAACNFNTDCVTQSTMYCNNGACACYSDYTAYEGYCYAKIDPGTIGCAYDFQCSAVWPGATCDGATGGGATTGRCRCPSPEYIERTTRDGVVCVKFIDPFGGGPIDACPLPENGGYLTALGGDPTAPPPNIIECEPTATTATATTGLCQYLSADGLTSVDLTPLYDCIEGSSGFTTGICCPNRAFTCIQPKTPVSTSFTAETRYWYNSVTGGCEVFLYDPFDASSPATSPNNFRTLEHCQSYCGGFCDRGSPDYDTSATASTDVRDEDPDECTYTTDCADTTNYQCEVVSSVSYCCPTVAYNCGQYGGLSDTTQALPNLGFTDTTQASSIRYYYDSTTQTCKSFRYLGAGGNFNNFLSSATCLDYCQASVCTQGNPLKDGVGDVLTCGSSNACPTTHTCYNNRCCPKPRFVCQQEKRPGDGASSTNIRYWWNQYTRQCEELLYTGQNGNDNNFRTLSACQSYCSNIRIAPQCQQGEALVDFSDQYAQCGTASASTCGTNYECIFDGYVYGCCPTKAYICGISSNAGIVCNGPSSTRYYFNTLTQTCSSFSFNGCDGNPNNFKDLNTCNTFCGAGGCPYGGTPYQATGSSAFATCTTTSGCIGNYECTTVTLGTTTNNYCCPSRAYVCQQAVYSGSNCGTASLTRWVYRYTTGACEQFTFTGCAGTPNSFSTQQQCLTFCGSSACLPGETARADAFGSPLTCTSDASCGTGYKCRFDSLTSRSFCCGSDTAGVCNADQRAYLDPVTGAASQCTPSLGANACFTGYNCQLNIVLGKYYCCTSLNGTYCPPNRAPYLTNGVAQSCALNTAGVCQTGYSCQAPTGTTYVSYTGYCCTNNDVCPTGGTYYQETTGTNVGSPRACTTTGTTCPTGFYCSTLAGTTSGYCCSGGTIAQNGGCPTGMFILPAASYAQSQCNPFNGQQSSGCPATYPSCQFSFEKGIYACCGSTAVVQPTNTGGCPGNQVALISGGSVVTCSSNAQCTSVQAGYFCQYSVTNSRLQCCAEKGTCTGNDVAFVDSNGNRPTCTIDSQCAIYGPYRCLAGNCCTGGTGTTVCGANQILFNGQCVATGLFIGQTCLTTGQCTGSALAQCINGICTCPSGTTSSGNSCLQSAQIGQACTTGTLCQGNSICTNGICTCPAGRTNQGGVCTITTLGLAPTCKTAGQTALMTNGVAFNCLRSTCATGYACEWNSVYNGGQYICCTIGASNAVNRCPTGRTEPSSRISCLRQNCPAGFTCTYYQAPTVSLNDYVCCSNVAASNPTTTTSRCDGGRAEQPDRPNCLYSNCAFGYNCAYSAAAAGYICCASSTSATGGAANPSSSTQYCTGAYLSYYNTNTGVPCNVDNDCVGTQYPKCLQSNTAGYKVCCASGGTQSYGK